MTRKDFVFLTEMFQAEVRYREATIEEAINSGKTSIVEAQKLNAIREATLEFAREFGEQLKLNNPAFDLELWNKEVGLE